MRGGRDRVRLYILVLQHLSIGRNSPPHVGVYYCTMLQVEHGLVRVADLLRVIHYRYRYRCRYRWC